MLERAASKVADPQPCDHPGSSATHKSSGLCLPCASGTSPRTTATSASAWCVPSPLGPRHTLAPSQQPGHPADRVRPLSISRLTPSWVPALNGRSTRIGSCAASSCAICSISWSAQSSRGLSSSTTESGLRRCSITSPGSSCARTSKTTILRLARRCAWCAPTFGNTKKDLAGRIDLEYLRTDLDDYVKRLEKKGHFIKDVKRKFTKAGTSIHDTIDPQGALQRRKSVNAKFSAHPPPHMRPPPKVKSAVDAASSAAGAADQSLHACPSDVRV